MAEKKLTAADQTAEKKRLSIFSSGLFGRKERSREAEEAASRLISNTIAENERTMIEKLQSIDFLHSRLPKAILEQKKDPRQPAGDLEYAARYIVHIMEGNPQSITTDIREIDCRLLELVLLYKQTVEGGDRRAAEACRQALLKGIRDIRFRIPKAQPDVAEQFVEANAKYLDNWIALVGIAQIADRTEQSILALESQQRKEEQKSAARSEELRQRLMTEDSFALAYAYILDHDSAAERFGWSDLQREIHRMMIERRMDRVNLQLKKSLIDQKKLELRAREGQVSALLAKVAVLPIIRNDELQKQFEEGMETLFEDMAKSDAEIDNILQAMDDIEGRLQQLEYAPGMMRAEQVAAEEAKKAAEKLKEDSEARENSTLEDAEVFRLHAGLRDAEGQKTLREDTELYQ